MDFQSSSLPARTNRRTYLVTYSQADRKKFPTRKSFGECVVEEFNIGTGKVKVEYWACCLEPHKESGEHYHVVVKLSGPKRWMVVKNRLMEKFSVSVNFSEGHDNYYAAYRYIKKMDEEVYHSEGHPNLSEIGSPRTKNSTKALREKRKQARERNNETNTNSETEEAAGSSGGSKKGKVRRLSNLDVAEFIVSNNIKTDEELLGKANEQKKAGKKDLASFIFSRSLKNLNDLIETTWKMETASANIARKDIPRMEMIRQCAAKPCVEGCNGQWLKLATETLRNNNVHPMLFADALRTLLSKGRGKYRNIMIVGKANCAKTFLFGPLEDIFKAFSNPATNKFSWIGADKSEVIVLNDFRWSVDIIAWKDFLLLLEGQTVHLPSPKNHFVQDICITTDIPIFATGPKPVTYIDKFQNTDETENEMMAVRWRVFEFYHQIPKEKQIEMSKCPKCFADLTLMGEL